MMMEKKTIKLEKLNVKFKMVVGSAAVRSRILSIFFDRRPNQIELEHVGLQEKCKIYKVQNIKRFLESLSD